MPYVLPDTTIPIYPNTDIVLQVLNPLKSFPFTLQNTREHDIKFLPDRIVILRSAVLFSDYTPHCVVDAFQKLYIPLSYLLSGETETHGPYIKVTIRFTIFIHLVHYHLQDTGKKPNYKLSKPTRYSGITLL